MKKIATGIASLEFLQELDALLAKHGARLVVQRTFNEHALQARFADDAGHALTLAKGRPGRGVLVYAGDGFESLGS